MSRIYGQPIDFNLIDDENNLKAILKAYDAMYWILTNGGAYPAPAFRAAYKTMKFMQQPLPQSGERIPREKILEVSCIEWCVAHAFGATGDHIGKISTYINNQILLSALLMTVTAPLFLTPPEFGSSPIHQWFEIIVSGFLGLATFFQLFCLVAFTALLNMIK